MTEKIARRGIKTPSSYEPDILEKISVEQVMEKNGIVFSDDNTIREITDWLQKEPEYNSNYYIISNAAGEYKGILSASNLFSKHHKPETLIGTLVKRKNISIDDTSILRTAVEMMASENIDVLPVLSNESTDIVGILTYHNIISSYKSGIEEHTKKFPHISMKRKGLKILIQGQKIINSWKAK